MLLSTSIVKILGIILVAILEKVAAGNGRGKSSSNTEPFVSTDTQLVCDQIYGKDLTESLNAAIAYAYTHGTELASFDCRTVPIDGSGQPIIMNRQRLGMICPGHLHLQTVKRQSRWNPSETLIAAICMSEEEIYKANRGLLLKAGAKGCRNIQAPNYATVELDMDGSEDQGTSYSAGTGSWGHQAKELASFTVTELSGPVVGQTRNTDHLTVKVKPGHRYRACAQAMVGQGNAFVSFNFF